MASRPVSIRNVSWAVVRDGSENRHSYRRNVDFFLKDGKIVEIREYMDSVLCEAVLGKFPDNKDA